MRILDSARNALVLTLAFSLGMPAWAADRNAIFDREKQNANQLSEFIYGDEMEQRLVPVYLLGAVRKPGIYHVPPKTSLVTLLSIAGGTEENSVLDEITIRNEADNRSENVDFGKLISQGGKSPVLSGRDTVFVPTEKPAVSNNTLMTVTVVATLLTAVLTGLLIKREL